MSKKKLATLALLVCFGATAIAGASLAYFTDTDKATNVFTVGNVQIVQNEQERKVAEDGTVTIGDFVQNKNVVPAVHSKLVKDTITVDGYDFKIRSLEGNYVDKIVNVKNKGANAAYMRTIIAVPNMNGYDDSADATENPLHWNYLDATDFKGIGWDWNGNNDAVATEQKCYAKDVTIDGASYDIYVATYNEAVAADAMTSPSMVGFYLDDSVNYDEEGYFSMQNGKRIDLAKWMVPGQDGKVTLKFLVATQACQTEGFADAWEALDAAFGAVNTYDATKLTEVFGLN